MRQVEEPVAAVVADVAVIRGAFTGIAHAQPVVEDLPTGRDALAEGQGAVVGRGRVRHLDDGPEFRTLRDGGGLQILAGSVLVGDGNLQSVCFRRDRHAHRGTGDRRQRHVQHAVTGVLRRHTAGNRLRVDGLRRHDVLPADLGLDGLGTDLGKEAVHAHGGEGRFLGGVIPLVDVLGHFEGGREGLCKVVGEGENLEDDRLVAQRGTVGEVGGAVFTGDLVRHQFLRLLPEISAPLLDVLCRKNTAHDRESAHFAAPEPADIVISDSADRNDGNRNTLADLLKICRVHGPGIFFCRSPENSSAAQIVRPRLLGGQGLFYSSGRDADDSIISEYGPGLGRCHIALPDMNPVRSNLFCQHHIIVDEERYSVLPAEAKDLLCLLLKRLSTQGLFSELHHGDTSPKSGLHLLRQRLPAQPALVSDCIQKTIFQFQTHFKLQFHSFH